MQDKLTPAFKLRARKLFSQAYGYNYVAAISTIKIQFPAFDATQTIHWYNLIDKCEAKIQESEVVEITPESSLNTVVEALYKMGIYSYDHETFLVNSYKFATNNVTLGSIGYNLDDKRFFVSFGRFGRRQYVNEPGDAFLLITKYARNVSKVA